MSENEAPRIIIDDSRVMLQIVALLSDDSSGIIYNMLIRGVQKLTGENLNVVCAKFLILSWATLFHSSAST
jgi:hypothetical protein